MRQPYLRTQRYEITEANQLCFDRYEDSELEDDLEDDDDEEEEDEEPGEEEPEGKGWYFACRHGVLQDQFHHLFHLLHPPTLNILAPSNAANHMRKMINIFSERAPPVKKRKTVEAALDEVVPQPGVENGEEVDEDEEDVPETTKVNVKAAVHAEDEDEVDEVDAAVDEEDED
jgi:hypothetical protein